MKSATLVSTGPAHSAFEIREAPKPVPTADQLLVKVEGFGLNYADVMARLGIYPDAPPIPAVLGYEVVGRIESMGSNVSGFEVGQRVLSFTRFGGYAEYAVADQRGSVVIQESVDLGKALALSTQYATAYFCAEEQVRLFEGDQVLVHAAAGGVGTALVQLAKRRGCTVFGTASTHKLDHLRSIGVDHPIDYRNTDFVDSVTQVIGKRGLDVIFDPVGGDYTKRGIRLLGPGGRLVLFGASSMTSATNIFKKLKVGLGFGIYHPVTFVSNSKSLIGVNMLRIGDGRPEVLQRVMKEVMTLFDSGDIDPVVGKVYPVAELAEAHEWLESRKSIGKIGIRW